jgi:hypothetical protein
VKTIFQVMKEKGDMLNEFKSPLSSDWETLVFKVIDILHNFEREGCMKTSDIKMQLLPMIAGSRYDSDAIRTAIGMIEKRAMGVSDSFIHRQIDEMLEMLNAVVDTLG